MKQPLAHVRHLRYLLHANCIHSLWEAVIAVDALTQDSQERAYLFIKERILDRRFQVNQHLRAQELAEATSLSRTPVREALGRLAQEGLVERNGGWGFTVRSMTFQDVTDLFNVREALEVEAARAALEQREPGAVARMRSILEMSRKALDAGEHDESIRLARGFHAEIAACSGNRLLWQMLQGINDRIHMVGLSLIQSFPERAAQVYQENLTILEALDTGDGAGLERAVRSHIGRSRDLFMQGKSRHRAI